MAACYGPLMAPDEEPGVCSASPPAIVARGPEGEGWITGTRFYAWQVLQALERLGSVAAVANETGLSAHQVRVAVEWAERSELAHPSGT